MWLGADVSAELAAEDQRHDEQLAERLAPFLSAALPGLTPARLRLAVAVMIQVTGSFLDLATRHGPRKGKRVVEEGKRMLRSYIHSLQEDA